MGFRGCRVARRAFYGHLSEQETGTGAEDESLQHFIDITQTAIGLQSVESFNRPNSAGFVGLDNLPSGFGDRWGLGDVGEEIVDLIGRADLGREILDVHSVRWNNIWCL
jgi:hypothetical protein